MATEPRLQVALAGDKKSRAGLVAALELIDDFALLEPESTHPADVIVLVHAGGDPREQVAALREHTSVPVVLATATPSSELVRWSLEAGVADVLALPASPGAILFTIDKAVQNARAQSQSSSTGRVVTVFSPKGGSGKSVVSTNLAVAAATHGQNRTLLVDLDLQFGDAAIMLGLAPPYTVRELIDTSTTIDAERLDVYTERHASGVDVLSAPMNPEDAELVDEEAVRVLLGVARETHDVVVVDTAPFFYGPMLATLDHTDELLVLCNPDIPTLKNVRVALKTLELLSFPDDRIRIVLNRAATAVGLERGDVESALDRKVDFVLPLDPAVPLAVNRAEPAVLAHPDSPFAGALVELARATAGGTWAPKQRGSRTPRIFSLGRS